MANKTPDSQLRAIRKWQANNKDKIRAYNKIWSLKNQDKMREYRRAYYLKNKSAFRAYRLKWIDRKVTGQKMRGIDFNQAIEAALNASDPHRAWFYEKNGEALGRLRDRDRIAAGMVPGLTQTAPQ